MANKLRLRFVLCAGCLTVFAIGGPLATSQPAWAQERGSRDGEGRGGEGRGGGGDWRGGRSRGGEGGRGDWRGGRSRDEERKSDSSSRPTQPSTPSSSSSDAKPSASSSTGSSSSMNYSDYAKGLVKQYDKNGDNMLQADEQKELRGRAAEADDNKDGTITIDELVSHLSSGSSSTPSSTPSPSSSSSSDSGRPHEGDKSKSNSDKSKRVLFGSVGGPTGAAKEGEKQRRTYRFTPAAQKLPTGLPGWFTSKDVNHDGQVSMSEYGKSWTERSVADYQKIDVNNDGVITPKEATKAPSGG